MGAAAAAAGVAEEDEMHGGDAEAEGCGPWVPGGHKLARCDDGGGRGAANSTDRVTSENPVDDPPLYTVSKGVVLVRAPCSS